MRTKFIKKIASIWDYGYGINRPDAVFAHSQKDAISIALEDYPWAQYIVPTGSG